MGTRLIRRFHCVPKISVLVDFFSKTYIVGYGSIFVAKIYVLEKTIHCRSSENCHFYNCNSQGLTQKENNDNIYYLNIFQERPPWPSG